MCVCTLYRAEEGMSWDMLLLTPPFLAPLLSLLSHLIPSFFLRLPPGNLTCPHTSPAALSPLCSHDFRRPQGSLGVLLSCLVDGALTPHSLHFTAMPVVAPSSHVTPSTSPQQGSRPLWSLPCPHCMTEALCDNKIQSRQKLWDRTL